jgi:hypothetical protein
MCTVPSLCAMENNFILFCIFPETFINSDLKFTNGYLKIYKSGSIGLLVTAKISDIHSRKLCFKGTYLVRSYERV